MGLGNTKRLRGHERSIAQRFPEKSPPEGPRAGELLRCRDTLLRGRIHPPSHGYSSFDAQKHHVGLLRGRTYDVHREAVSCEAQERHCGIHQNRGAMRSCSCHGEVHHSIRSASKLPVVRQPFCNARLRSSVWRGDWLPESRVSCAVFGNNKQIKNMRTQKTFTSLLITAIVALGTAVSLSAADKKADPNGTWTWTMQGRGGQGGNANATPRKSTLKLKADGDKLTGTLTQPAFGRGGQGGGAAAAPR